MAKFEYLLTFLSAMICEPCILMLEQRCKRKKRIHSRFSETACKMSLTLFPLVQWQFFLNECSTLHFFFLFSFVCFHFIAHIYQNEHSIVIFIYVMLFSMYLKCLCHCACKFRMDECFTFEKCDLKFQISKEHHQNITSLKNINDFSVFFFYFDDKIESII